MSYELLKQVISHLKRRSACPFCKSKFTDYSIFVLATSLDIVTGSASGLFLISCPKCSAQAFLMAEVSRGNMVTADMPLSDASIRFQTKPTTEVTSNDILDMHNLLKNFKGDVSQLFKEL